MEKKIIIVGGGAAGLMTASCLSAEGLSVVILEAAERLGGRILTLENTKFGYAVEAGAEFIHGDLPLTAGLLREAGIGYPPVGGEMVRIKNGRITSRNDWIKGWDLMLAAMDGLRQDMTILDFLNKYFPEDKYQKLREAVQSFAQGYDAADVTRASVFALRAEWQLEEGAQFRVQGGYLRLIEHMECHCLAAGVEIVKGCVVKEIRWKNGEVVIGTEDGRIWLGQKAVVTVSLGILQASPDQTAAIKFEPEIPAHVSAARKMGFGAATKILLGFSETFWDKAGKDIGFILSAEQISTWWTQLPGNQPLLTGWMAGPQATKLSTLGKEGILQAAISSLANIFGVNVQRLKELLIAWEVADWHENAFCLGGYSYSTLQTAEALKILSAPLVNTLYFAGEAIYQGNWPGTVESALASAKQTAEKIITGKLRRIKIIELFFRQLLQAKKGPAGYSGSLL